MADRRYTAFISYSHRDKRIANWLHHALETYRLPPHLIAQGKHERLRPIFKDRDELAAAESLDEAIESAILHSDALIILCSPAAAESPWIAREIDCYKRLNGDRGVLPVVVEGDPPDCFPAPLLVHYEDGAPTERKAEPVAADMRPEGDGRKLAKLKLVAALTGVDLDHLVQRDAARRQRKLAVVAGVSALGMIGTSALAAYAIDQRNEAREQRAEADGLIEYMLTDLRQQLEPVGRLELLDGVGQRAMDYYARQKLSDLSATELGRRARAVQLVAEVQNLRGNNAEALPAFRQSARTTAELLARRPDDPERMFNHGQSLFWVGYIAWQHGKMDEAKTAMQAYADISHELAAKDRTNFDWQLEESYSLSNLGTMAQSEGELKKALVLFRKHVATMDSISQAQGRPAQYEIERAGGYSWISSTLGQLGRVKEATAAREEELRILDAVLKSDPANSEARMGRIYSLANLGQNHAYGRHRAKADRFYDEAITEFDGLSAADPENTLLLELVRSALRGKALLCWSQGRDAETTRLFDRLERIQTRLRALDPDNYEWTVTDHASLDLIRALTDRRGQPPASLIRTADRWKDAIKPEDKDAEWMLIAGHLIRGFAFERSGRSKAARAAFNRALAVPETKGEIVNFKALALRGVAARRAGDAETLRKIERRLDELDVDPMIDDRLT